MGRELESSASGMNEKPAWFAISLAREHRPDYKDETQRIQRYGGAIRACRQSRDEAPRVWLRGQSCPGVTLTRSIGDILAASVGLSFEPEILTLRMKPSDKALVIGTAELFRDPSANANIITTVARHRQTMDLPGAITELLELTGEAPVALTVIFR
jgi:hypothetical protein